VKLLPVAERELRIAARRSATYWVRFCAAAVGIGAAGVVMIAMLQDSPQQLGQALFSALSILAFIYCVLSGVLTTSDSVSEEKRDGTLGLLFLTSLRGYDIVIGKLAANSVRAISGLVVLIPILGLPLLMGGIPVGVVWKMAVLLLNTMFLSLAIGVLVSVLSRDAHGAMNATLAALLFLMAIVPLVRMLVVEYLIPPAATAGVSALELPEPFGWSFLVNPAIPLSGILGALGSGRTGVPYLWPSLIVQHGMAWAALACACTLVPRVWRDHARARGRSGRRMQSAATARGYFLDDQPLAWLVVRQTRPALVTWIGLGIIGLAWVWGFAELGREWFQGIAGLWTLFVAALWLKLRVASMSCKNLHDQRRGGALELVLCTPRGAESLVEGHLAGIRHIMTGPLTVVLAAGAVLMLAALEHEQQSAPAAWMAVFGVVILVLVMDVRTLAWAGMWHGLRSQRYNRAYALTIAWVLLLPWVLFIVTPILAAAVVQWLGLNVGFGQDYRAVLVWWTFLALGVDLWVVWSARRGVPQALREFAGGPESPAAAALPLVETRTAVNLVHL
jgi:ABC-type transport system involved in cytochrome c biogenesis permease component